MFILYSAVKSMHKKKTNKSYRNDMISISDFSIHLMHFTSEPKTPITFLFVNENVKDVYAFS